MSIGVFDRIRGAAVGAWRGAQVGTAFGGRMIRAGFRTGYSAMPRGRRAYGWGQPTDANINSLIQNGGDELRRKAREMIRNNGWAAGALSSFVANSIGTGIVPKPMHPSERIRKVQLEEWKYFVEKSDADGRTDFYGQQALAVRSSREAGEVLVRFRPRRKADRLRIPFQLQMLEGEHLPFEYNYSQIPGYEGSRIVCGIEFNNWGQRSAYHLYDVHPGEWMTNVGGVPGTIRRVAASELIHMYQPLRPGQLRGQPWLTPIMIKLHELMKYDDAELVRKGLTTMLIGWTRSMDQQNPVIPTVTAGAMPPGEVPPTSGFEYGMLEPGAILDMEEGHDMGWYTPPSVDTSYETFMKVQLRAIAAALDVTYEMLSGDLERVNYSSIRQGVLEFRRRCEQFQYSVVVHQLCKPVWAYFNETLALLGKIDAGDYEANPEPYLDVAWMPPRWDWVDPLKDSQADVLRVRAGFTTRSSVVESQGFTAEEVDNEQAADNARADSLGLAYESDGRQATKAGGVPGGKEAEQEAQRQADADREEEMAFGD